MTNQPGRPYATPEALRTAVTARARRAASSGSRFSVSELLRQFAYSRLLARVFTADPDGWVLKGGIGLLARMPAVRHTLDLDLWSGQDTIREAELALERASALDLDDHVRFEIGPWTERWVGAERALAQAAVTCRIGRPEFSTFGVDVLGGPFPPLQPEAAPPLRPIEVPGLVEPPLRLYPLAGTVADKLCGVHMSRGGRSSTRYRDVVDLATIALTQRLTAHEVHLAVHEELRTQRLPVPAEFTVPDRDTWATAYAKSARGLPHLRNVGFDDALALVKAMIDPILRGRREGVWRPEARAWESGSTGGRGAPGGVDSDLKGQRERGNLAATVADRPPRRSRTMRALVADPSASPALSLADVPEPSPGPGQLLVRMLASSINRGEIRTASRQPPGSVIGWDIAGDVVAVGDGVTGYEVGERVLALSPTGGAFAELAAVPAVWTTPLPAAADPVLASTLPIAGITAMNILRLARVHAGDRVLVTGAAGGVGQLAVQLAVDAKATVSGQASSEQRADAVRELGAEPLIHPGDGSPIPGEYDVVLDGIGGPMFAQVLRATVQGGRVVVYGNSADAESTLRVEDFYSKAITIYGFRVFQSVPPEQGGRDLTALAEQLAAGRLRVAVQDTAPLEDALRLVRDLYDRRVVGKVAITG